MRRDDRTAPAAPFWNGPRAATAPNDRPEPGATSPPADAVPDQSCEAELSFHPADPAARLLCIACGALAREVLALRRQRGLAHLDIACLPAILHNRPERIPDAVARAVAQHRNAYDRILVLYADCGTGGALAATCAALGVEMLAGPHCYAVFDGPARFVARDEATAFYLTDFLVRQFDAFVWQPLGLDRHPELRDTYFGHYEKLVYLAQTEDADLDARAAVCAARLGLTYERRVTGYGALDTALVDWASAPELGGDGRT